MATQHSSSQTNNSSTIPLSEIAEYCSINYLQKEENQKGFTLFLVLQAQAHQATDIHIDFIDGSSCFSFRIDGILTLIAKFNTTQGQQLIDSIKSSIGLFNTKLASPWSGEFFDPQSCSNKLTVHVIPFTPLDSIIIRCIPQTSSKSSNTQAPAIGKKIFIWQMGKVGSASLLRSLQPLTNPYDWDVEPIITNDHWLKHNNIFHTHSTQTLYNFLHQSDEEFLVISLVRDLLSRNISSIFQSMCQNTPWNNNFIAEEEIFRNFSYEKQSTEITKKLTELNSDDHLLNWFNNLFKSHIYYPDINRYLIDIIAKPFNQKKGCQIYDSFTPRIKMLILRLEDLDTLEEIIGNFLDIKAFKLIKDNISSDKWYKDIYKKFREQYKPTRQELDKIYNSHFMQYFYSPEQIELLISNWTNN